MSKAMYFSEYGNLEHIDREKYLAEPWKYLCSAEGEDGELYDIVIQGDYPCKLAYTTI